MFSECCIGPRVTPKVNIFECFSGVRGGAQEDDGEFLKEEVKEDGADVRLITDYCKD